MLKLGVLVSGGGTNLQSILDAVVRRSLDAEVVVVVSNRPDAGGLARARAAGVPTAVLPHRAYPSREAFDAALVEVLRAHETAWVVLAGFMRLVTPVLLGAFPDRVLNIHPALLPAFPGAHAQAQALAYGARVSGCTVHLVDAGMDSGPIVAQRAVLVHDDDTVETLTGRILAEEHALLPAVLQWIAEGRVSVGPAPVPGSRARVRVLPG